MKQRVTSPPAPTGDLHHGVHVFRELETVPEEDKEKPQNHE